MIVTSKVNVDLLHSGEPQVVEVIQDDRHTRNLELSLFNGGNTWAVPAGTDVLIRYHKPDDTGGEYNLMPDGTTAWHAKGNILTISLTPQMLTIVGDVLLTVLLTFGQKQISTPRIIVRVNRGLTLENTNSKSYYNVAAETIRAALGFAPVDRERISLGLHANGLLYLFIDGNPVGTGIQVTDPANDAVLYTAQALSSTQMEQARENIGAVSENDVGKAIAETIAEAIADITQLEPSFANSIEECIDTTKVYVLPDGYIYGYMYTTSEPPKITIETTEAGYWGHNDEWVSITNQSMFAKRTNLIAVSAGDKLSVMARGDTNAPSVIWFDESQNIVSWEGIDSRTAAYTYTVPAGAAYARFYSFGYTSNADTVILNVTWVLCQVVVTGYQWASTGHAFVPTDYEDRVLDLEEASAEHTTAIETLTGQMDSIKESLKSSGEVEITIEDSENGYWSLSGNWVVASGGSKRTNLIPVSQGDQFIYTGRGVWGTASVIWYDSSEAFLASEQHNDGNNNVTTVMVTAPAGAAYVRFISYSSLNAESVTLSVTCFSESSRFDWLEASNCLYGKKYVACGDSFTAGDFTGIEKTSETWSDEFQTYKTYPYWIANRNRMTLVNEAICGTTMHNNGSADAFSVTRYTEIPTDADYITLCFGLNETNADIGTLKDTTNETVLGAWNVVLEYLITKMPYAKIGIIIPDAWCTETMRNALISVAQYWGIPWLDTKGDPKVSLMLGGRYSDVTLSSKAKELRDAAFRVSDNNSHPNAKAHECRSTVIENFLRSL